MNGKIDCVLSDLLKGIDRGESLERVFPKINISNARYFFNTAVVLYRQENYSNSKKILEHILDSVNGDRSSLGLLIKSLFLFIEVSIGCCVDVVPLQSKVPQLIALVDGSFRMLDSVYELINHPIDTQKCVNFRSSDEFIAQLQIGNIRLFEYHQVVSAILYFQTLLFKCYIYIACLDFLSARKVVHNALEIFKHYLYRVVQSPQVVVLDKEERKDFSLVDYVGEVAVAEQLSVEEGDLLSPSMVRVSETTQRTISEVISGLFRTAIVLSARVEHLLGHHPTSKLLLGEPMLHLLPSKSLPIGDNLCAELLNNEGCVSLRQGEFRRAAALFNRAVSESCAAFSSSETTTSIQKTLMDWSGESTARFAVAHGMYNSGLVALKVAKFEEALGFFQQAATIAQKSNFLVDKPYIWVRMAECCLQLDQSDSVQLPTPFPLVATCSRGKSRRIFVRVAPTSAVVPLATDVTQAAARVDEVASADCAAVPVEAEGLDTPVSSQTPPLSSPENSDCSLPFALICLRRALETLKPGGTSADNVATAGKELEHGVLLRMAFIFLRLKDAHNALDITQRLLAIVAADASNQTRFLTCNYHLEALCMLGKHQAAGDFLKTQLAEAASACAEEDVLVGCRIPANTFIVSHATRLLGGVGGVPEHRRALVATASMQVNKAVVLITRGFLSSALTVVESALRVCPDFSPAVQCLVYIYLRQGRTKQAINVLGAYKQTIVV